MTSPRCVSILCHFLIAFVIALFPAIVSAAGPNEWIIHDFGISSNGAAPVGGLVADQAGNLFGTTAGGGTFGWGTVYELLRPVPPSGVWVHTVLYNFANTGDGGGPASGLVFDDTGDLYGTTSGGGGRVGPPTSPNVFKLTHPATASGTWTESVIYTLGQLTAPAGLSLDSSGALYGVTRYGGNYSTCGYGCGIVYKLTPPAAPGQAWTQTILHAFDLPEGQNPAGTPILDGKGNLYGVTLSGIVYVLVPQATPEGSWTFRVLYDFSMTTHEAPTGALTLHNNGHLYGLTAPAYNSPDAGIVFELVPPATPGGTWTENTLHTFTGPDGAVSIVGPANVIFDNAGNLYGTTAAGGHGFCYARNHCGVVFELTPPAIEGRPWTETLLYDFPGKPGGRQPSGGLIFDRHGVLFGSTSGGGVNNNPGGVVFGVIR